MRTTSIFFLSKMSDNELLTLASAICEERARRERERKACKDEWVYQLWSEFMCHPNASCRTVDKTTIVAVYDEYGGINMGTARPVNGDTYDQTIGVAVAYAKATRQEIPNFI